MSLDRPLLDVRRRRPDIADFWLDAHRPLVLSDVTANVNRLFHNFKTRFYAEVLSRLTGMPVEAWEILQPSREEAALRLLADLPCRSSRAMLTGWSDTATDAGAR